MTIIKLHRAPNEPIWVNFSLVLAFYREKADTATRLYSDMRAVPLLVVETPYEIAKKLTLREYK